MTGIDHVYCKHYYPVAAVVHGLYSVRVPDKANFAPTIVGRLHCMVQRVIGHFEVALRSQSLTDTRRKEIQEWEARVHDHRATVDDVAIIEKTLTNAVVLKDIAGEDIYNSGKD